MDFQVWDFPGQIDVFENPDFDMDAIFGEIGALIWVIDAQDEYLESLARLTTTILTLQRTYPAINIEVFIHKVDSLSDEYKLDVQRDITIRIQDDLSDHGFENAPITFHLTSIYNHSIFEAFSKVIQKLIPRLGTLESMLTNLCRTCRFEKAYLFDVLSKIYIATDGNAADMASYEICSDYIDVIIDMTEVYGTWQRSDEGRARLEGEPWSARLEDQVGCGTAESCLVLHDSNKPIMLREVDRYLALVAIMKEDSYDRMPLVNMNVEAVVEGLTEFFNITKPRK
jgi:Ras-related GTP-binding protein C/D